MKKNVFLILLLYGFGTHAQNLTCEGVVSYPSVTYTDAYRSDNTYYIFNERVFIVNGLKIIIANKNGTQKEINLGKLHKGLIKKTAPGWGYNYAFDGRKLILKNKETVFIFYYNGDTFLFDKSFALKNRYGNSIYVDDHAIIFYEIYNQHPKTEGTFRSGFLTVDLKTGQETLKEIEFNYLSITHFSPNHFIDFTPHTYMVCDPFTYQLSEYNADHILVSRIRAPDSLFTVTSNLSFFSDTLHSELMSQNPAGYFPEMNLKLAATDRIWMMHFIDTNTVFVRMVRNSLNAPGESRQLFYDHTWQRTADGWKLIDVKPLSKMDLKKEIGLSEVWPYFFPGTKLVFCDQALYYILWAPITTSLPQDGETFYGIKNMDRDHAFLKVVTYKPSHP